MPEKDLIIVNAKVTTLDKQNPSAEAVAIRDGRFLAVGPEARCGPPRPRRTSSTRAGAA